MSYNVIEAENLAKRFQIGSEEGSNFSFREMLMSLPKRLFSNSKKSFIWALDDISFQVKKGESVAILGHNGSGKSTLLKLLSRITEPTKGQATIKGKVASMLEVGAGFHPELSGRENIFLNGSIMGMGRGEIQKKFSSIVDFAEIELFLDTPVKHYSSGMYTRLAFAVAVHIDPDILIIDEVLAVGDARFQQKCLSKMQEIWKSGKTLLFVSHNLDFVRHLCSKGILLSEGKLISQGPIEEVISKYTESLKALSSCRYWDENGPASDEARLISVESIGSDGVILREPTLSEEITLKFTFEVIKSGARVNLTATLNSEGRTAFQTLSNLSSAHETPLEKGIYSLECILPKDLFNEGYYSLDLTLWKTQWTKPLEIPRVIALPFVDDGALRKEYPAKFEGCIRPRCEWRLKRA